MENDEINLLKQHNQELKEAYNTILESCKKEQTENEKLKKELKIAKEAYEVCLANKDHRLREFQNVALQSQNAAKSINQQAEEYEEQIIKLKKELCDWQNAYKELENAHDKIQGVYQDDHCDLLKYKQTLQKIKKYIAKICKEECGYVQKKRCPDCDCRYGAILDLINKAEEEDETKNT